MGGTKHVNRKIRGKEATYETRKYCTRECDIKLNLQKGCDYDSWAF